jgi:hypothetical protein
VTEAEPVDEVRDAPSDQETERHREYGVARSRPREVDDHPGDGDDREDGHGRCPRREEPEGDPRVPDMMERERARHVH